jgi:hypothetical protein
MTLTPILPNQTFASSTCLSKRRSPGAENTKYFELSNTYVSPMRDLSTGVINSSSFFIDEHIAGILRR